MLNKLVFSYTEFDDNNFKKFATTFFYKQKSEKIHPTYRVPITELKIKYWENSNNLYIYFTGGII